MLELRNAAAAIPVAERGLESAHENLRVTRDRYREGVIPSSELLDAEVALQRAGLDRDRDAGAACGWRWPASTARSGR